MLMDTLETSLAATVHKDCGEMGGVSVEKLINNRASKIFGHKVYSLYGPGQLIAISEPHEEFFNSALRIWIGGENISDGCCRPIRIHKVWRYLALRQHKLKQLSIMRHEAAMIRESVVPGKHAMATLMLALKEAEIKTEDITVHMHQGQTEIKQLKDKDQTTIVMVHVGHISETTTQCLPTEE